MTDRQNEATGIGITEVEALANYLKVRIYRGTGTAKDMYFCEAMLEAGEEKE